MPDWTSFVSAFVKVHDPALPACFSCRRGSGPGQRRPNTGNQPFDDWIYPVDPHKLRTPLRREQISLACRAHKNLDHSGSPSTSARSCLPWPSYSELVTGSFFCLWLPGCECLDFSTVLQGSQNGIT